MFRNILFLAVLAGCGTTSVDSTIASGDLGDFADRPVEYCGGFAGLACSDSTDTCEDDPSDTCDPNNGGADCIGICTGTNGGGNGGGNAGNGGGNGNNGNGGGKKCKDTDTKTYVGHSADECAIIRFTCDGGDYFADECGCGCEVPLEVCGGNTCAADEFCCNESCGICAPTGGVCTQQFCTGS